MGFLVWLYRHKPELLWLIIVGLIVSSLLVVVIQKATDDSPSYGCQGYASSWRHETQDVPFFGSNAMTYRAEMRAWANSHSQVRLDLSSGREQDELYEEVSQLGYYAVKLQGCVARGDYSDDILRTRYAPLKPPKDEWRDCLLNSWVGARGEPTRTVEECEPVLYEAVPWLTERFPY